MLHPGGGRGDAVGGDADQPDGLRDAPGGPGQQHGARALPPQARRPAAQDDVTRGVCKCTWAITVSFWAIGEICTALKSSRAVPQLLNSAPQHICHALSGWHAVEGGALCTDQFALDISD